MSNRVLVTGGAGFVGTNVCARLLRDGEDIVILDNFSRDGVRNNLSDLRRRYPKIKVVEGDVRNAQTVRDALVGVSKVFHFAAQVAVTSSLVDPIFDFSVNAQGTLTLLEEIRKMSPSPSILFTSTNKVYGALEDVKTLREEDRYSPVDARAKRYGLSEDRPLQFSSPYGCSKGAADQYVLDYAKSYDIDATVFRMSCIYGPYQRGTSDQGWVAHFVKQALLGEPLTIYGDGCQVRDLLFVDDLVELMVQVSRTSSQVRGEAFNVGGGPSNATSLIELIVVIEELLGKEIVVNFAPWRAGDQRWFVADARKVSSQTGWIPSVSISEGIKLLFGWLSEEKQNKSPANSQAKRLEPTL